MKQKVMIVVSAVAGYTIGVVSLFIWAGHNLYEDLTSDDE